MHGIDVDGHLIYDPPIEEFSVAVYEVNERKLRVKVVNGPSIMIVTSGNGFFHEDNDKRVDMPLGSVWFLSAEFGCLEGYFGGSMVVYQAFCEV